MNNLKIKLLRENSAPPKRASQFAAGYDLYASIEKDEVILPGETKKIGTGFAMEMPEIDNVGLIFARSSLGTKYNLIPANAVGVIDYDYRGEVIVALHNGGKESYIVKNGDRIAQLVILRASCPETEITNKLSETSRGSGGFGSTGKN